MRKCLGAAVQDLSRYHYPRNVSLEIDDLMEYFRVLLKRDRDQVSQKLLANPSERLLLAEGASPIDRRHSENLFRLQPGKFLPKRPHFREQTQRRVARETVGSETDVESEIEQSP